MFCNRLVIAFNCSLKLLLTLELVELVDDDDDAELSGEGDDVCEEPFPLSEMLGPDVDDELTDDDDDGDEVDFWPDNNVVEPC